MQFPAERDECLREYATERQWEILEAFWKEGSYRATSDLLQIHPSRIGRVKEAVLRKAVQSGYGPDYDLSHKIPDGYRLKGTSTFYNSKGELVAQWVKTQTDHNRLRQFLEEFAASLAEDLPRAAPEPAPEESLEDLLAVYPIGDHHFGLYAWGEEAGGDYDLDIAEDLLTRSMSSLTSCTPKAGTGLVIALGDLFHYDGLEPVTPASKNLLDSDGRYAKMIRTGVRTIRRSIQLALLNHQKVHVIIEPGNHDPSTSVFLAECLRALYEGEARVEVDTSPRNFHYFRFGKNLLGVHHGHGVKLPNLPLIMATDRPEDWGETLHRFWMTGHIHKDTAADYQGVRVESFRVLPPTDAWAENKGYRGHRRMSSIVFHREHGEVARFYISPEMLK